MKSQGRLSDPWLTWVLTMYRLHKNEGSPPYDILELSRNQ